MATKSIARETSFVFATSRNREAGVTFRLQMARDEAERLAMGARIKELRAAHGFKQQYIADQVGVQLRTYQMWQAGDITPEQENLEKLAELFDVTPKYILKGETPEPIPENPDRLSAIEDRLAELDDRMGEIVALLSSDTEATARLSDAIVRAVEQALARQAREAGLPDRRRRQLPPAADQRPAA